MDICEESVIRIASAVEVAATLVMLARSNMVSVFMGSPVSRSPYPLLKRIPSEVPAVTTAPRNMPLSSSFCTCSLTRKCWAPEGVWQNPVSITNSMKECLNIQSLNGEDARYGNTGKRQRPFRVDELFFAVMEDFTHRLV